MTAVTEAQKYVGRVVGPKKAKELFLATTEKTVLGHVEGKVRGGGHPIITDSKGRGKFPAPGA